MQSIPPCIMVFKVLNPQTTHHACRHVMKQIFGKHIRQQLSRSKRIIAAIQLFLGNLQHCSGNAAA